MRVKLIILILQTLRHFNNVLRNVDVAYSAERRLEKDSREMDKKLAKEIKYQETKLV